MFELLEKNTTFKILDQEVTIKQLSYIECIEFHYNYTNYGLEEALYNLLRDKMVITKKDFLKINILNLFEQFSNTIMRGFYDKKKGGGEPVPLSSYFLQMVGNDISKVREVLKIETPESINFLSDGWIRNINDQTKRGKKLNYLKSIKKNKTQSDEEMLEKVKAMREKRLKLNK